MLKSQRNDVLHALSIAGLDPSLLEVKFSDNGVSIKLLGSPTYRFRTNFRDYRRAFIVTSVPGRFTVAASTNEIPEWAGVIPLLTDWAQNLKNELTLPDLWAEAAKTAQLFAPTSTPTDDKFTRTELAEVQGQLRLMQQSFATAALPEAARQKLIELTQTAAVKAEGLTKKDWQNWIIGGFISAIASCALNPTQAAEVLKLVKAAFGGLFLH